MQRSQTKWVVSDGVFRIDPHQHTVERRHRMQHGEGLLTVPIKARRGIRWDHVCEGTAALWGFFPVLAATAGPAALIAPSQTVSKADRIPIVADRRHPSLHHRTSLHAAKFPAPHSSCPDGTEHFVQKGWAASISANRSMSRQQEEIGPCSAWVRRACSPDGTGGEWMRRLVVLFLRCRS